MSGADDVLAARLYEAYATEFNPNPSWADESTVVHARWHNVADVFRTIAAGLLCSGEDPRRQAVIDAARSESEAERTLAAALTGAEAPGRQLLDERFEIDHARSLRADAYRARREAVAALDAPAAPSEEDQR